MTIISPLGIPIRNRIIDEKRGDGMYLEDYKVGMEFLLDPISFTKEEIIDFAQIYDPRPIHIEEGAAKESRFKGIISSGMLTLAAAWGKWVHTKIDSEGVIAGIGFDKIRWLKPVYPNMDLYGKVKVLSIKESQNGQSGTVNFQLKVEDTNGEEVMILEALVLIAKSKP